MILRLLKQFVLYSLIPVAIGYWMGWYVCNRDWKHKQDDEDDSDQD